MFKDAATGQLGTYTIWLCSVYLFKSLVDYIMACICLYVCRLRVGIVDGQHRTASLIFLSQASASASKSHASMYSFQLLLLLCDWCSAHVLLLLLPVFYSYFPTQEGKWDENKRNVLVDVFETNDDAEIKQLFMEINSGEAVRLIDMPVQVGVRIFFICICICSRACTVYDMSAWHSTTLHSNFSVLLLSCRVRIPRSAIRAWSSLKVGGGLLVWLNQSIDPRVSQQQHISAYVLTMQPLTVPALTPLIAMSPYMQRYVNISGYICIRWCIILLCIMMNVE